MAWFTIITEHPTGEGKLYICEIKDACSNRIMGLSMGPRMTWNLACNTLRYAINARSARHCRRAPSGTSLVFMFQSTVATVATVATVEHLHYLKVL